MDTMEITKIIGALCGSLLIFLLIAWGSEERYKVGGGHYGDHQAAYIIEVEEDAAEEEEVDEGPDFATLLASADIAKGEKVFSKCKSCHKLADGANGVGPHLYALVGRDVGVVDGYGYSSAMAGFGGAWTPENLNGFLENPKGYMNGTKMAFKGLGKPTDRANLIAYLETVQ